MESHLKHGNRRQKEGLTLLETVIALGILAIVSAAVASITVYSTNAISGSRLKTFFNTESNSILEYYLSYEDVNYKKAVKNLTNTDILGTNEDKIYYTSSFEHTTNVSYEYYIGFNYLEEAGRVTLTLTSYTKAGASFLTRSVTK